MGKIKKFENKVTDILINYPETRDSDYLLYYQLCNNMGINTADITLETYLKHRKDYGFPNWETIRRVRQKIQEYNPQLRENAYDARQELQEDYRAYARGEDV